MALPHIWQRPSRVNYFGPQLLANLPLVRNALPVRFVSVQCHGPLLAIHDHSRLYLFDDEPLLKVTLPPIKVRLVLRAEPFFFEFLPDLAPEIPSGKCFMTSMIRRWICPG